MNKYQQMIFIMGDTLREMFPNGCSSNGSEYEWRGCEACTRFINKVVREMQRRGYDRDEKLNSQSDKEVKA